MAHHPNDSQLQQPQTKSAVVVTYDKAEAQQRDELHVLITNATTPMAHTIASAVAQGYVFGYEQPIILHLLGGKETKGMLEGLVLELLDCTYPLLRQVVITSVDDAAFMGIDATFLLYEAQGAPVNHGVQLFRRYGAALEKYSKKTVKVVVCGCQSAINAYACIQAAPSIDKRSITALTRLEHNQGTAEGTWVSMGVISNGAYGVPKGIVYSFPVRIDNKEWQIVEGIVVNPHIKKRIDESAQRTMNETLAAVPVGAAAYVTPTTPLSVRSGLAIAES